MRLTFLGTGTSGGVPSIGCDCAVCRSTNPHDKRLRSAALLETNTTRILIDSGPDIRQQLLAQPFRKIDAVLLTHTFIMITWRASTICDLTVYSEISIFMPTKAL